MSFIKYKENIFSKKRRGVAKKRSHGRLKTIQSCTDSRAWSSDPKALRDYMLESVTNTTPSTSAENIIFKQVVNSLKTLNNPVCSPRLIKRRTRSADNLYIGKEIEKLEAKMIKDDETIVDLKAENKSLKKINSKTCNEVDHLKNLIKDLKEEVSYLEALKGENHTLHSQIDTDYKQQILKAKNEINRLSQELDFSNDLKDKYNALKHENELLRNDLNKLNHILTNLEESKCFLANEFNRQKEEMQEWRKRSMAISSAVADREILRERIQVRDKKILHYNEIISEQKVHIQELTLEVKRVSLVLNQKEEYFTKILEDMKHSLLIKDNKVVDLKAQLDNTELLVKELETLRDQFRLTNKNLRNTVLEYKKQFNSVVDSSEQLTQEIGRLQKEIKKKDEELEKLKLYPQSSKTMIQFAQLAKIIMDLESGPQSDIQNVFQSLIEVRKVAINLTNEMWGSDKIPIKFQIASQTSQTDDMSEDVFTQWEEMTKASFSQTSYPDEYLLKYKESVDIIQQLNLNIDSLKESLEIECKKSLALETELDSVLNSTKIKGKEIEELKENNKLINKELEDVNGKYKLSTNLLNQALYEIQIDNELGKLSYEIFDETLENTVQEYNLFIKMFECLANFTNYDLEELLQVIIEVIFLQSENDETTLLKSEIINLKNNLECERDTLKHLNNKINSLLLETSKRSEICEKFKNKYNEVEYFLNHLLPNNNMTHQLSNPLYENKQEVELSSNPVIARLIEFMKVCKKQITLYEQEHNSLFIKLKNEQNSKNKLKKVVKYNKTQKQNLKQKSIEMFMNVKRMKKMVGKLRNKLLLSEDKLKHLMEEEIILINENDSLKKLNNCFIEEIGSLKMSLSQLNSRIKLQDEIICANESKKKFMEAGIYKLVSKLNKYKSLLNQDKITTSTMTSEYYKKTIAQRDQLNSEIDLLKSENISLSTTISKLQDRVTSLFEIPQKESYSVEVQVFLDEEHDEGHEAIESIKSHYECIIKALQIEHTADKEQSQKQYINNLKMLKDTYERDMKSLKKIHADNLSKLQNLHEQDLVCLKEMRKEKLQSLEVQDTLERIHQEQLEALQQKYERLLLEKETAFKKEKLDLLTKIANCNSERQTELHNLNTQKENSLLSMQNNYETVIKKLKEKHKHSLYRLIQKYKILVLKEISRRELKRIYARREKEIQCGLLEYTDKYFSTSKEALMSDKFTEVDEEMSLNYLNVPSVKDLVSSNGLMDVNYKESICCEIQTKKILPEVVTSLIPLIANDFNCSFMNVSRTSSSSNIKEKQFYIERIAHLEEKLIENEHSYKIVAASYEKKLRSEQLRVKELVVQLDQEMKHNTEVHFRLGLQYNRAEQLQLEKEDLMLNLNLCQKQLKGLQDDLAKERDKIISMKQEINLLKTEPKESYQLEKSLNRLKDKIDQAVECEKRLTEELKKDLSSSCMGAYPEKIGICSKTENVPDKRGSSLKFVVIKECGVMHTWEAYE